MSNQVLAQSATQLTITGQGESNYDFAARVKLLGERAAKGITRERQTLNRAKLVSSLCADYKAHFAAIYENTNRLPSEIHDKICEAVDIFIQTHINRVNIHNAINFRRAFHHNDKQMSVTERVIATGENSLSLQEQKFGITLFITQANNRLRDLMAKVTPDYDREKDVKEQIMRLETTKSFIMGEIAHQEKELSNPVQP
jgi:hypothetical protein